MPTFVVYALNSGDIRRSGSCPPGAELDQVVEPDIEAVMISPIPGVTDVTHYVALGPPPVITAKATMALIIDRTVIQANASQSANITNVPLGSSLTIDGIYAATINDGHAVFSATDIGVYTLLFEHYRYQPATVLIYVGVIHVQPAIETERGRGSAEPLPRAQETEIAPPIVVERIIRVAAAIETESARTPGMILSIELVPASERELGQPPAVTPQFAAEGETAPDIVIIRNLPVAPAIETETAFDAAA